MPLDPPPLLRRLAGAASPPVRRALAGLWLDVTGLPTRLTDPRSRAAPWQTLHNVGGGDYRAAGEAVLHMLRARAGLRPDHSVLDIGCGTGRVATPLASFLTPQGRYVGFDVSRRAVQGCVRRFAASRPDFRFVHADLRNAEYNASGAAAESAYRFPADDGSVDVATATSVFSHMRLPAVAAYLAEGARVLAPDGRLLFTAYAVSPVRPAPGLSPFGAGSHVLDLKSPERMIAHDSSAIDAALTAARLRLVGRETGRWRAGASYDGLQDLFVAARA